MRRLGLEDVLGSLCQGKGDGKPNMCISLPQYDPTSNKTASLSNPLTRTRHTWLHLSARRLENTGEHKDYLMSITTPTQYPRLIWKWLWGKTLRILNVKAIHFYISIINLSFPFLLICIGNITAPYQMMQ